MMRSLHGWAVPALVVFAGSVLATAGSAQTVVRRARLGHAVEDVAYVRQGPLAGHLVELDGYEAFAIPLQGGGSARKVFDLRDTGSPGHSQGIAWIDTERVYAVVAASQPFVLRLIDGEGRDRGTRPLVYPGTPPEVVEGLDYIPAGASTYPDHLVLATNDPPGRIQVIRRDGTAVAEVAPAPPVGGAYITALAYREPGRLLVVTLAGMRANEIYTVDFAGNVVGGPVRVASLDGIEGLQEVSGGRIAAADFFTGRVRLLDPGTLDPLPGPPLRPATPSSASSARLEASLSFVRGLAWDSAAERHLVTGTSAIGGLNVLSRPVWAIDAAIEAAHPFAMPSGCGNVNTHRLGHLPDERKTAMVSQNAPRAILLLDEGGELVETVDVSAIGRPTAVAYLPSIQQFVLRTLEGGPLTLHFVTRAGTLDHDLDLTPTGVAFASSFTALDPGHASGGELLVAGTPDHVVRIDLDGNVTGTYDLRSTLRIRSIGDLSTIDTGPDAGSFGLVDAIQSELVVFRLP